MHLYVSKNPNSAMNRLHIYANQIEQLKSVIISMSILKTGIERGKYKKDLSKILLKDRWKLCEPGLINAKNADTKMLLRLMLDYNLFNGNAELSFPKKQFIRSVYYQRIKKDKNFTLSKSKI